MIQNVHAELKADRTDDPTEALEIMLDEFREEYPEKPIRQIDMRNGGMGWTAVIETRSVGKR